MIGSGFKKTWIFFYLVLLTVDLAGLQFYAGLHAVVKPLLMPVLIFLLVKSLSGISFKKFILVFWGLIFSFLGDVFLLLEDSGSIWFLAGLGSFLITHICYILFFENIKVPYPGWWKKNFWVWGSVALYGLLMVTGLWNNLNGLKVPVIVYTICISVMVIMSQRVKTNLPYQTGLLFSVGAILFMVSDSILAINKFYHPSGVAPLLIMLTYGLAQLFITLGTIRLYQRQ